MKTGTKIVQFLLSRSETTLFSIAEADLAAHKDNARKLLEQAGAQAQARVKEIMDDHGVPAGAMVTFKRDEQGRLYGEYEVAAPQLVGDIGEAGVSDSAAVEKLREAGV